jgi:hypothetical protein
MACGCRRSLCVQAYTSPHMCMFSFVEARLSAPVQAHPTQPSAASSLSLCVARGWGLQPRPAGGGRGPASILVSILVLAHPKHPHLPLGLQTFAWQASHPQGEGASHPRGRPQVTAVGVRRGGPSLEALASLSKSNQIKSGSPPNPPLGPVRLAGLFIPLRSPVDGRRPLRGIRASPRGLPRGPGCLCCCVARGWGLQTRPAGGGQGPRMESILISIPILAHPKHPHPHWGPPFRPAQASVGDPGFTWLGASSPGGPRPKLPPQKPAGTNCQTTASHRKPPNRHRPSPPGPGAGRACKVFSGCGRGREPGLCCCAFERAGPHQHPNNQRVCFPRVWKQEKTYRFIILYSYLGYFIPPCL